MCASRVSRSDNLPSCPQILSSVREKFYEEDERRGVSDVAVRLFSARRSCPSIESPIAPAQDIIPGMKAQALRDTHLVFSGLVALGSRPEDSEYWKLATTFGARCSAELTSSVTHLVANQAGTAKVHSARRNPRVKVVYPQWLLDSVARWVRLDEQPYLLPPPEDRLSTPGSPIRPELSDGESDAKTTGTADVVEADLDLGDLDWGDAMKEVDDLLLETDDDDDGASSVNGGGDTTDGESDNGGAARSAAVGGRKRPRISSTPSDTSNGSTTAAAESPLQKRVKTARSRRSGLKTSMSAAEGDALVQQSDKSSTSSTAPAPRSRQPSPLRPSNGSVASNPAADADENGVDASQASSSIGSDDEDLLAMAADLESGW